MFDLIPFRLRNTNLTKPYDFFDMNSIFSNFFNDALPSFYTSMKVDIKENEKDYVIEAELPGVKKEEIAVDLVNNVLTISVERNEEVSEENERYIRKERRYGVKKRSFVVEDINDEKITAKFENGILTLALPKKNPSMRQQHKINIQ